MSDIQYVYPLIHNKVTSPHYVTPTLRRARLIDWLNDAAECRAVVVAADAGYGKTTLLWQWEREVDFPCYWYKLDRNDRDWSLHISYLIEAISQRHTGFGRRAHSMLEQLGGPGSSRPGVAAYLLAEMYERLTEPCTFIIDDWQFVASVTEVRGLWNQILRDAPPTCRFIFLSRGKPHLQFARFKTHGGYAELRTDALRFNDREIDELFRDIYNDPLDPTELVELERRTEGWAASLQLVEVSLREKKLPEERRAFIESITATRDNELVEFLAEEVLDQQPARTRNFLLTTSILARVTPDLAARLAGEHDGAAMLLDLENQGLFTYRLGSGDDAYRYHGLFREFLERRLSTERSDGEVAALHIHTASFYETSHHWPEAIHHYLKAGLQPQAARLIAKYGEDMATTGRLPLLEGWLRQLPDRSITENARLSLLAGEVAGMVGDWPKALRAIERAGGYFSKKGDRRMQAMALSKLSTIYNNLGNPEKAGEMAEEGLRLAPDDDLRTRLRLRGNKATSTTWLISAERAERECKRIAAEAEAAGLEQFAAVAHHNLGLMARDAGRVREGLAHLDRAARYWDASPSNPFADNAELVQTLLLLGYVDRAATMADAGVRRTQPWVRTNAEAWLGKASVLAYHGEYRAASEILERLLASHGSQLGAIREKVISNLIEYLYLDGSGDDLLDDLLQELSSTPGDPRLAPLSAVSKALAAHRVGRCEGHCQTAEAVLDEWERRGCKLAAALGRVPLALLGMEHRPARGLRAAIRALASLADSESMPFARQWLEHFVPFAAGLGQGDPRGSLLVALIGAHPRIWSPVASSLLPGLSRDARESVLRAIESTADASTAHQIRGANGSDVQDLRRRLIQRFADPLFVRGFGSMTIHRGAWESPGTIVPRKRMRLLLGLLLASSQSGMTRDEVVDALWGDSDPSSAVNSLNQTVFQLRRIIQPDYREGETPQYIHSSSELVQLNPELVETDLRAFRDLAQRAAAHEDPQDRLRAAEAIVGLIRGEFLADLKYEDWVAPLQMAVHAEVRAALLPIADGSIHDVRDETALQAGQTLLVLDPYDELAHVAIARRLASSGRRNQAREHLDRFARRLRADLDEEPSEGVRVAAALVGSDLSLIAVD